MSLLSGNSKIKLDVLFNNADIDDRVRQHLAKVYSTLGLALGFAAAGAIVHMYFNIGGILSSLACIGLMIYLALDQNKTEYPRRIAALSAFGFFQGASLGPLMAQALHVDPSIIVTAFLATTTIFACFTGAALLARRRSYLYLGGILSSALSALFLLSVVSMFFSNPLLRSVQLYAGLFMFCGYILFDTQVIIEKVSSGDTDFVWHSVELFIDFVAIFVRIVVILLEFSDSGKSKKEREKLNAKPQSQRLSLARYQSIKAVSESTACGE
jgi:FtsH-binding integral membrane protein